MTLKRVSIWEYLKRHKVDSQATERLRILEKEAMVGILFAVIPMHVLIVTHHKSQEEILALCDFLHLESDAIFANQIGREGHYDFDYRGFRIDVHEFADTGVSKNRNHLLDLAPDGICLCVDDDCPLFEGYANTVNAFFAEHQCDVALFNGLVPYEGNRKVHEKETARVKRFKDVSYAGGPGLAFLGQKLKNSGIRYDERLGYPNDLFFGEDSLFTKRLAESNLVFYRSEDVIFTVAIDKEDNSSYFHGFDDKFFFVKGAVGKLLYPHRPFSYPLYQAYVLSKKCDSSLFHIYKKMREGRKSMKGFTKQ